MKNAKKGFTLIELIIVIAIISIISLGVMNIVLFLTRFFSNEDADITRQNNVRIVVVNFEKDVRKSDQQVSVIDDCVNVNSISYCLINQAIYRDSLMIADNIGVFDVVLATDNTYLDIVVESTADSDGETSTAQTRIYLRKGD